MTTPPKKRNRANIKTKEAEKRKLNSVIINTKVSDVVIINVVIIKTKGCMSRTPRTRICTFFCHPRFFLLSPYLHFTTYSHPEWPFVTPTNYTCLSEKQIKKILSYIWHPDITLLSLYSELLQHYSCLCWMGARCSHPFVRDRVVTS